MLNIYRYLILFCCIGMTACGGNSRTEQLDKREAAIAERERKFASKSEDYDQLVALRDNLAKNELLHVDSISENIAWTDSLVGDWESRLVCISTSCRGYVIGDQRTEQWTFLSDTTGYQLQIYSKTRQAKTYWLEASGNRNELVLSEQGNQNTPSGNTLIFNEINSKQIRGQKRNTGSDNCKLVFSVLLTPRSR